MENNDLNYCTGNFLLPADFLADNVDKVQKLMEGMVVVGCRYLADRDAYYYTAISPKFKKAVQGYLIHTYKVVMDKDTKELSFEL